jgi:hypothetical protein
MRRLPLLIAVCVALVAAAPAAASVKWFFSPSGNLSCEVSSGGDRGAYAYCQSISEPRSATLKKTGHTKVCRGSNCLGDSPENATELGYGKSKRVGAFKCTSKTSGIRCVVVKSGRGFAISHDGVKRF